MKYLLSIDTLGKRKYYNLKVGQEERISELMNARKLPHHFKLNGETVVTSEILGFTNDKQETKELGIKSMDDLREWAQTQPWYKMKRPEPFKQTIAGEAITLIP